MNRALLWKEWREQRPLVLTGLLVTALMPLFLIAGLSAFSSRGVNLPDLAEALPGLYVLLLWPLFAVAAGAGTVATEIGDGTLGFLLSRPVSRLRVWLVKVGMAAAAFTLVVLCSGLVSWILHVVASGGDAGSTPGTWDIANLSLVGLSLAGAVLVMFSTAVFFSTVLSRAMTAAAAGLVAALTLLAGIFLVWSRMDLVPLLEPQWIALEMGLMASLILLASLYLFSRGEMLRGKGARKTALVAVALALLGGGVGTLPVLFASFQVTPEGAGFDDAFLSPSGDAVVASVARANGASPQVWLIPTDGSGFRRLTGRLTMAPALSPDGEWLAYVSLRGTLGMRSSAAPQIRVMRLDGRDDHAIGSWHTDVLDHDMRFDPPRLAFSPDSTRVLVSHWRDIGQVLSLDGSPGVEITLEGTPLEGGSPFDWSPGGSEVLVLRHPSEQRSGSTLGAVNPGTGEARVFFETTELAFVRRWRGGWLRNTPLLGSSLAIVVRTETPDEADDYWLSLIDLEDGSRRPITHSFCLPSFDMDRDEESMVYLTCPEKGDGKENIAEVHRWKSDGSDEVLLTSLELPVWSMFLSPAGERVVFRGLEGVRVLDPDGSLRDLDAQGWQTLGWAGKDRMVTVVASYVDPRVWVVNVTNGDRRQVFPHTF